jgi:hypothetical protein
MDKDKTGLVTSTDNGHKIVVRGQRTLILRTSVVHGQLFLSVKSTSCPWTVFFVRQIDVLSVDGFFCPLTALKKSFLSYFQQIKITLHKK